MPSQNTNAFYLEHLRITFYFCNQEIVSLGNKFISQIFEFRANGL